MKTEEEDRMLLRSVALQNANAVTRARERAEKELIKTKEDLERTSERLHTILDSITDGFISFDADWRVIYFNRRVFEILRPGSEPMEELLGLRFWQVFPEMADTVLDKNLRAAMQAQDTAAFEYCHPPLDAWFEVRAYPSAGGLSVYFQDVTGHRRVNDALRSSEQRLRATFEQAAVGIAIADLDGRFIETNHKFADILGYTHDELRYKTFVDVTHPDDLELTRREVTRLRSETVPSISYEKRYVRKDGGAFWSLSTVTLLRDEDGNPLHYIGVIEDITPRKLAELERERMTGVLERSLNEIYIFNTDTLHFEYVNEGARRNLGYTLEEMRRKTPLDIKPEFTEPAFRRMVAPLLSGTENKHVFFTVHRRADGTEYPVEVHLQAVCHADNRVFLAVILDISERRMAEAAITRRERELRDMADSMHHLAWMSDPAGEIFWYNQRWYEYTGATLETMHGWGWQAVHDPAVLPSVLEHWRISLASGEPFEMEFPLRGADGVYRWFLTRANPLRDENGLIIRWFGTNTDLDEVRRAREALREEGRILEILNDTGATIAAQLDLQTVVQTVTDAATKLCGAKFGAFFYNTVNEPGESLMLYTLSGAPREAFEKFGMPRNTPVFRPTFTGDRVVRSGDITRDPAYGTMAPHHGMPAGHLPVCSYLAVPVVSRSGEVMGGLFFGHPEPDVFTERAEKLVVGIASQAAVAIDNARLYEARQQEIGQRIEAERKLAEINLDLDRKVQEQTASLRQAISQMEEFSYSISHDLRAPVRAIDGYTSILKDDFGGELPPGVMEYLDKIHRNTHRMNDMIQDVLTISRISSTSLVMQPVELLPVLREIINQYPQMQPPSACIDLDVDATVVGDKLSLSQAFTNLLSNAVKFIRPGITPRVRVWCERMGGRTRIWIEDNGIGIKPECQSQLFGMFERLRTDHSYEGTGVGLAIVRKAIERMGGAVGVESDGLRGSRFWVELNH